MGVDDLVLGMQHVACPLIDLLKSQAIAAQAETIIFIILCYVMYIYDMILCLRFSSRSGVSLCQSSSLPVSLALHFVTKRRFRFLQITCATLLKSLLSKAAGVMFWMIMGNLTPISGTNICISHASVENAREPCVRMQRLQILFRVR
jgi:hypothetical protein